MVQFDRVIGCNADIKELQYISALHQTCIPILRDNATVSNIDIQRLIKSKYNIDITHKQSIQILHGLLASNKNSYYNNNKLNNNNSNNTSSNNTFIVKEQQRRKKFNKLLKQHIKKHRKIVLQQNIIINKSKQQQEAAILDNDDYDDDDDDDDDIVILDDDATTIELEEYMDLVQILATLLVPTFAGINNNIKHKEEGCDKSDDENNNIDWILQKGLDILYSYIIHDDKERQKQSFNNDDDNNNNEWTTPPIIITEDLIEGLLLEVGEYEYAQDYELIQQMVQQATAIGNNNNNNNDGQKSSVLQQTSLNLHTLKNALSYDLKHWNNNNNNSDNNNKNNPTTFIEDVYGRDNLHPTIDDDENNNEECNNYNNKLLMHIHLYY